MRNLKRWNVRKFTLLAALLLSLTLSGSCLAATSEYDGYFKFSHARFLQWHDPDWLWLKAQGVAESNLQKYAVSSAGAKGIMQFMPGTWRECQKALNIRAPRYHAKASIFCGGWYMRKQLASWTTERSTIERWRFAWASYNAGLGTILKAQKRAGGSIEWRSVKEYAPRETRDYVHRIPRLKDRF